MPGRTRRRYTEEVKGEVVRLVRDSVCPVTQVTRDLGIADNVLYLGTPNIGAPRLKAAPVPLCLVRLRNSHA